MRRIVLAAGAAVLALAATGAAIGTAAAQQPGQPQAQVAMSDAQGKALGTITLTQFPQGVLIHGELEGLRPGWHAIHIHENGACTPDFRAAGGHYNPGGGQHGVDGNPMHLGDLPNIWANESGKAGFEIITHLVRLGDGQGSLFKQGGTSVVVHAQADDYASEPAGNSGDRVACGIVKKS